jgi:AP-3 complex subunit delta-1
MTNILKTTLAMSLLYECVDGIVDGGILASVEGTTEGDELAKLCVGKLRSMLVIEGDPNRKISQLLQPALTVVVKYVALLTFEKIVKSHPYLVSLHQDVILECIDDPDISIRMRALELVIGMVNPDNLTSIVDRLLNQLLTASPTDQGDKVLLDDDPYEDSDEENAEESLRNHEAKAEGMPPLPDDYRTSLIQNILDMCAKDTYANLNDFEWYIEVLRQLVKACPMMTASDDEPEGARDISYNIGSELQNVAVRVKAVRKEATVVAETLVQVDNRDAFFPSFSNGGQGVLEACSWLVGEYAEYLGDPKGILNSLLHSSATQLPSNILCIYLQAMLKVFSRLSSPQVSWTPQRRTEMTLLMARIIYFLEPLTKNPDLGVQELAVEYLELMRLASEAAAGQAVSEDGEFVDAPLLLTQAIPALFSGSELNPIAAGAQEKVEVPAELDLDTPIDANLQSTLRDAESEALDVERDDFEERYYRRDLPGASAPVAIEASAADRLDLASRSEPSSYQNEPVDPAAAARARAERRERNRDDPFYIADADAPSSMHAIIRRADAGSGAASPAVDLDAIPVLALNLDSAGGAAGAEEEAAAAAAERQRMAAAAAKRRRPVIAAEESMGGGEGAGGAAAPPALAMVRAKAKASSASSSSVLAVDSSGLRSLSLEESLAAGGAGGRARSKLDVERREEEERALREVERLRLEMQRAAERVHAREEAVVVKRKKKKTVKKAAVGGAEGDGGGEAVTVKRKKKRKAEIEGGEAGGAGQADQGTSADG